MSLTFKEFKGKLTKENKEMLNGRGEDIEYFDNKLKKWLSDFRIYSEYEPEKIRELKPIADDMKNLQKYIESMEDLFDVNKIEGQIQKGEAAASTAVRLGEQDFRFTTKKDSLFVIAMDWPSNGTYHIHTLRRGGALEQPVRSVTMLGTGEMLPFEQREDGLYITVGQKPDAGVSVYAMQIMV